MKLKFIVLALFIFICIYGFSNKKMSVENYVQAIMKNRSIPTSIVALPTSSPFSAKHIKISMPNHLVQVSVDTLASNYEIDKTEVELRGNNNSSILELYTFNKAKLMTGSQKYLAGKKFLGTSMEALSKNPFTNIRASKLEKIVVGEFSNLKLKSKVKDTLTRLEVTLLEGAKMEIDGVNIDSLFVTSHCNARLNINSFRLSYIKHDSYGGEISVENVVNFAEVYRHKGNNCPSVDVLNAVYSIKGNIDSPSPMTLYSNKWGTFKVKENSVNRLIRTK